MIESVHDHTFGPDGRCTAIVGRSRLRPNGIRCKARRPTKVLELEGGAVVPPGGERPAHLPGELAPCPLCGHGMDAKTAELYRDALYIDRVSDLGKFLEAQGLRESNFGLMVRSPTFTIGKKGLPP